MKIIVNILVCPNFCLTWHLQNKDNVSVFPMTVITHKYYVKLSGLPLLCDAVRQDTAFQRILVTIVIVGFGSNVLTMLFLC